ncbi:hypothetical protein [Amycolatopsis nigrescens]|uniref:hypothetical protein n=1 Tax=Amycolatopsis nigrescens TaxID=381445 RepID=UPI000377713A|nr:hypothetical protein [Amycolatopsis nigrescens]
MGWLRRLFGDHLPDGFPGALAPGENALASAAVSGGGALVVTELGLWVPDGESARRVGWHLVGKATWGDGVFTLSEAVVAEEFGAAVLLAERPPVKFVLEQPGRVPLMVRQRVDGSIRERHHQELEGGGAWFVQRKVPGEDGIVLQVRADPGVDPAVVAAIAREAGEKLAGPGTGQA